MTRVINKSKSLCYVCNSHEAPSHLLLSSNSVNCPQIRCIGHRLVLRLEEAVTAHNDDDIEAAAQLARQSHCCQSTSDRFFHPVCLGRPAGQAFSNNNVRFHRDRDTDTMLVQLVGYGHKLCDECSAAHQRHHNEHAGSSALAVYIHAAKTICFANGYL